ncbi:MAG TPA: hypothetical protein DCY93_00295, partial [Firmicutes bacterium]|nr:hypothetical protein [Bacillota bacterium]
DEIKIKIDFILKLKFNIKKLLKKVMEDETKKSKTKLDPKALSGIKLRELKILYNAGEDNEKLLYINSILTIILPVIKSLIQNKTGSIYYRGRRSSLSSIRITAKLIVCPIYILKIYLKSRRRRHEEEKLKRVN